MSISKYEEEPEELEEEAMNTVANQFYALSRQEREVVLGAANLAKFSSETKAVYCYLAEMVARGSESLIISVEVLLNMLSDKCPTGSMLMHFIARDVKPDACEGEEWQHLKFREIWETLTFNEKKRQEEHRHFMSPTDIGRKSCVGLHENNRDRVYLDVPGRPERRVVLEKDPQIFCYSFACT